MSAIALWLIAGAIAVVGVVQLFRGQFVFAVVLLVVACVVGPGGSILFQRRS